MTSTVTRLGLQLEEDSTQGQTQQIRAYKVEPAGPVHLYPPLSLG